MTRLRGGWTRRWRGLAVDVADVSYRDPVEAADVILGSVDLSVLSRAEREKLMRL